MNPEEKDEVVQLYLDDIIPNRFQPREVFDERALKELAVSIKEHGVIQPIIVRSVNGKYEIIAGERRYKASALAGLTKIPAIIRELDDKESSKVALLENLQRKNLNPIEEARTYQKILEIDEMTQEELAKTMGKSQSAVANKIRLLSLPDEIQNALLKEEISERHARTLLNVPTQDEQKAFLKKIIENKMSVRSLEEEIKGKYGLQKEEAPTNNFFASNHQVGIPEMVPSTSSFVNTNPLTPTADLPEDTSNYGKVTIAPPIGEENSMNNKFINYGEINKDEAREQDRQALEALNNSPVQTTADINELAGNASDIKPMKKGSQDLDNLLNLGNPNVDESPNKFITPAEKIVKTDSEMPVNTKSDYFQISDLSGTNPFPESMLMSMGNPALDNSDPNEKYTLEKAKEKIQALVKELNNHGIKTDSNEMDFDASYQVILKIDKDTEK